jgi:hypothetical protein
MYLESRRLFRARRIPGRPVRYSHSGLHREQEKLMPSTHRTTHRSTAGKKLYAVRDKNGRFKDIQTYERAHRADLKKKSKQEKH